MSGSTVTCGVILDGSRPTGSGEGDQVQKRALVKRLRLQLLSCVVLMVTGACGRPNATDFLQARAMLSYGPMPRAA
jgi:hypothetical protein